MSSNESAAYEIMQLLDVDYVLVIFGGMIGYSGDDINKFLWMVRIAEGEHPREIRVSDGGEGRGRGGGGSGSRGEGEGRAGGGVRERGRGVEAEGAWKGRGRRDRMGRGGGGGGRQRGPCV